jgi:hypothetical protein
MTAPLRGAQVPGGLRPPYDSKRANHPPTHGCADLRRATELAASGQGLPARLLPAHPRQPRRGLRAPAPRSRRTKPRALSGRGAQLDTFSHTRINPACQMMALLRPPAGAWAWFPIHGKTPVTQPAQPRRGAPASRAARLRPEPSAGGRAVVQQVGADPCQRRQSAMRTE